MCQKVNNNKKKSFLITSHFLCEHVLDAFKIIQGGHHLTSMLEPKDFMFVFLVESRLQTLYSAEEL